MLSQECRDALSRYLGPNSELSFTGRCSECGKYPGEMPRKGDHPLQKDLDQANTNYFRACQRSGRRRGKNADPEVRRWDSARYEIRHKMKNSSRCCGAPLTFEGVDGHAALYETYLESQKLDVAKILEKPVLGVSGEQIASGHFTGRALPDRDARRRYSDAHIKFEAVSGLPSNMVGELLKIFADEDARHATPLEFLGLEAPVMLENL